MNGQNLITQWLTSPNEFGLIVRFAERDDEGNIISVADPITFSPHEPGQALGLDCGKCFVLDFDECKEFMESMWAAGVRPDNKFITGDLRNLESKMLDDLRQIKVELSAHVLAVGGENGALPEGCKARAVVSASDKGSVEIAVCGDSAFLAECTTLSEMLPGPPLEVAVERMANTLKAYKPDTEERVDAILDAVDALRKVQAMYAPNITIRDHTPDEESGHAR